MIILGIILYGNRMFTKDAMYLCINSIILTLNCLSISYLVGNLLRSRNAQSAVTNVLTMGMCFIGGVFVPQELLGKTVLSISRFTPIYWFVRANNEIISLGDFNSRNLIPILQNMLIQLAFAAGILAAALIILSRKRRYAAK